MTMPQTTMPTSGTGLAQSTLARLTLELEGALESFRDDLADAPELDDISMAIRRRKLETHDEIVAALGRVNVGTYGICATCNLPISEERLEVVPHARHCIRCAH